MLNFDKLMTLVENSTAMNEQYEDAYPEMSMLEAAAYLPAMITESQLELAESINAQTEKAMDIMTESADRQGDLEALTEASLQGIKERILGFFKKVKETIMSIINKITQSINMLFKSNKEIVKKYQGKINSAKCADLTFNGYNVSADKFAARIDAGAFMAKFAPTYALDIPADEMKSRIEEFNKTDKETMRADMANMLTGMKLDPDKGNWGAAYISELLGEKTEIKYGSGMFTGRECAAIMTDDKALKKCKDEYDKILKDAAKKEKEVSKVRAEAQKQDGNDKNLSMSNEVEFLTKWLSAYQVAYNMVSQAKNVELKIIKIGQDQAKAMFGKMLKASTGKGSEE